MFVITTATTQNNGLRTCIVNRVFKTYLKNTKDWYVYGLKRTISRLITVIYHRANGQSDFELRPIKDVLLLLKPMRLIIKSNAPFHFFFKNFWSLERVGKAWQTCAAIFFSAQNSARTATDAHFLQLTDPICNTSFP